MYTQFIAHVNTQIYTSSAAPPQRVVLMRCGQPQDMPRGLPAEEYACILGMIERGWTALRHDGAVILHPVAYLGPLDHMGWPA